MRGKLLHSRVLLFVFIVVLGLPFSGFAEDVSGTSATDNSRLRLDLDLYFWPAGLDGDVSVKNHSAHTNIRFSEIIDDLNMGANGAFKISKGNWFLFNDFLYMEVTHKTSENIASIPGASVDASLRTRVITDLFTVGRQWQDPVPWNLFIGARYFYGKVRLDATEKLGPFHEEAVITETRDWVTPTVGAGINLPFNNRLSLNLVADVGAGARSFNWETVPTLCWKFNDRVSAQAGYRLLEIRHKENNFKVDTLMHGPIIGMKITF